MKLGEIHMAKIIDVIKYESDENILIYKHPTIDFNYGTQLIVHESQEAVFFKDGKALESFKSGAHMLDSKNLPFLKFIISPILYLKS